jgi:hypothetical protein
VSIGKMDVDRWLISRSGGGRDDRPPPAAEQNQGNNLHVSGLAKSVDVPMLEDTFGKIGKVSSMHSRTLAKLMIRSTRLKS